MSGMNVLRYESSLELDRSTPDEPQQEPSTEPSSEKLAEKMKEEGNTAFKAQRFSEAIELYTKAIGKPLRAPEHTAARVFNFDCQQI